MECGRVGREAYDRFRRGPTGARRLRPRAKHRSVSEISGEVMKIIIVLSVAALALTACQPTGEGRASADAASATGAPAGSAEAVQRILAIPVLDRCGGDWPGHAAPTANQVIDLGGGAFAVLTDCHPNEEGQTPWKTLHVQGADGMIKSQSLILFNGPEAEFEEGYDWEPSLTSEATWDAAAREFVWSDTLGPNEGETSTQTRTMRWRWDGSKLAMVSAVRVTHATPGATASAEVTGWPSPGKVDPTPAAVPV